MAEGHRAGSSSPFSPPPPQFPCRRPGTAVLCHPGAISANARRCRRPAISCRKLCPPPKRPARKFRLCPIRRMRKRSIYCQERAFHTVRCIRYAGKTSACDSPLAATSRGRIPSLHPIGNRSGIARRLTTRREAYRRPDGCYLRAAGLRSPCLRKSSRRRRCSKTQRRCGRHQATKLRVPSRGTLDGR